MIRAAEEIGNAHGRIALYLDRQEALDLASMLAHDDRGRQELLDAVAAAYPPKEGAKRCTCGTGPFQNFGPHSKWCALAAPEEGAEHG